MATVSITAPPARSVGFAIFAKSRRQKEAVLLSVAANNCLAAPDDGVAVALCVAMEMPVSVAAAIDAARSPPQVVRDSSSVGLAGPGLSSRPRASSRTMIRPPSPMGRSSTRLTSPLVPCETHASFLARFEAKAKKEAAARALSHPFLGGTKRQPATSVSGDVVKTPRRGELHGEATTRFGGPCPRRRRATPTNAVAVSGIGSVASAPVAASDAQIDVVMAEFERLVAELGPPPPRAADAAAPHSPRLHGLVRMETLLQDMEACGVARGAPVA